MLTRQLLDDFEKVLLKYGTISSTGCEHLLEEARELLEEKERLEKKLAEMKQPDIAREP